MAAEDPILLQRYLRQGDEAAFAELVQRYVDLVYGAALRQAGGDTRRAEEIAQVVFTRLARKAGELTQHPTIAGWLHTTTRFVASEARRAAERRQKHEAEAETMREATNDPAAGADWGKLRPVLDETLGELSDADREAIALRFFAHRPLAEIGAALRISENAARMRVERALEKLRSRLAQRGITSTSAALSLVLAQEAALAAPAGLSANIVGHALAGATAGGAVGGAGVTTGLLQIMSTTKVAMSALAVLGLAGLGVGFHEWSSARAAEHDRVVASGQLANARARIAALEREIEQARQQAQAARAPAPSPTSTATSVPVSLTSVSATSAAQPTRATPAPASQEARYASPEYVDLLLQKFRLSLSLKYGPLYQALQLTPDEIARFESALNDAQQGTLEIWSAAAAQGVALNSPDIMRMTGEPAVAAERKLHALLGEARYAEYRQFEKTNATRLLVGSLASSLYYTPAPLRAEQGELVARSINESSETRRIPRGTDRQGKTIYSLSTETDWAKVQSRLEGALTPAQLATLHALAEQEQLQARLNSFVATGNQPAAKQAPSR